MRRGLLLLLLLCPAAVSIAQWNSWQQLQPFGRNYIARNTSSVPPPAAPTNAAASQTQKDTQTVTWTDNSADETGFVVERSTGGAYSVLTTTDPDDTSYADATATSVGTTYTYRVKATNSGGDSAYSTASGVLHTYRYGYPAFGSSAKSGTAVAQWLFDEASPNNIVDEVNSISLAPLDFTVTVYGVTNTGNFVDIDPGIKSNAFYAQFRDTDGDAALNWTANNGMVLQFWLKCDNAPSGQLYGIYSDGNGENANLFSVASEHTGGNHTLWVYLRDSLNTTTKFWQPTVTGINNGSWHNVRLVIDPNGSGNGEIFLDEVSIGTSSFSGFVGKSINSEYITMMGIWNGGYHTAGYNPQLNMDEFRICHNITCNSLNPAD